MELNRAVNERNVRGGMGEFMKDTENTQGEGG